MVAAFGIIDMEPTSLDPAVVNLAKAIRQSESGGNFTAKGKSGEYGAYQYTPDTWAKDSAAAGVQIPLEKSSKEDQNKVAYMKLKSLKDRGYNVGQVASVWNAGENEPNAYLGTFSDGSPSSGVNKHGVKFDVPKYAKSVATAYQKLKAGGQVQIDPNNPSSTAAPDNAPPDGSLSGKLSGRITQANKALESNQSIPSKILQTVGAGAGAVNDVVGSALELIPGVKQAEGVVGQGVGALAQTPAGQSVINSVQGFSQAHPEIAGDIGAAGNIGGVAGMLYGAGAAKEGIGAAVEKGLLGNSLKNAASKKLLGEATDIVSPKITTGLARNAAKTGRMGESGLLGTTGISPDFATANAAEEIKPLVQAGKVSRKFSNVQNANAVHDEIVSTAEQLKSELRAQDIVPIVGRDEIHSVLRDAARELGEFPTMTGDAGGVATDLLKKFQTLLPKEGDVTAIDILNARQKLDQWVKTFSKGDIFDPKMENAKSVALRAVRQNLNKLIAKKAPSVGVAKMLAKQSRLYDALDGITSKITAKDIGGTRLGRFGQRHPLLRTAAKATAKYGLIGAGLHVAADFIP